MSSPPSPLLSVRNLTVSFAGNGKRVRVVDRVSFDAYAGQTLAIVGESGSGKSISAMAIVGLLESQGAQVDEGEILFNGRDLRRLTQDQLRQIRGHRIAMVFQEPMSSLNPVFPLGDQIGECLCLHLGFTRTQARRASIELLGLVGIPAPHVRVNEYPHQLSGGMRQRVAIAMALSCQPQLLIADEPTTALDVTVQAQILELLEDLQRQLDMAVVLITHDLGVVAEVAQSACVMYAGRIVEQAEVVDLFHRPQHPYTAGLLRSIPTLDGDRSLALHPIDGGVPDPSHWPEGCRFHPRCSYALPTCTQQSPSLKPVQVGGRESPSQRSACFHTEQTPNVDYRLNDFLQDAPTAVADA